MPRQSITLTDKNDAWLKNQVEESGDYANKSELVNDLIRRARRAEVINRKLALAESSGFVDQSPAEMLSEFKKDLNR
ncbi:ribbon-helix-helix domain-containing protein [Glaciecola sp. 1036]|uniref:ribbon-helix-helix domain-containing protein n=1 Tax=Alteromonadaceae TaxID=72275 RepID=UPI003CFD8E56